MLEFCSAFFIHKKKGGIGFWQLRNVIVSEMFYTYKADKTLHWDVALLEACSFESMEWQEKKGSTEQMHNRFPAIL